MIGLQKMRRSGNFRSKNFLLIFFAVIIHVFLIFMYFGSTSIAHVGTSESWRKKGRMLMYAESGTFFKASLLYAPARSKNLQRQNSQQYQSAYLRSGAFPNQMYRLPSTSFASYNRYYNVGKVFWRKAAVLCTFTPEDKSSLESSSLETHSRFVAPNFDRQPLNAEFSRAVY